jgi:hypothetical protein
MPRDDFAVVFEQLKAILLPFEDRLVLKVDTASEYSLDTPYSEKWKRELFFGAAQIKRTYVSFHLMPVYMFPDLLESTSAALNKRRQGKSCFNFTRVQPELFRELAELTTIAIARLEAEQLLSR